jgi:hypothetical protein
VGEELKEYLEKEMTVIMDEVACGCPVDSPEFNRSVLNWVRQNAAGFRTWWNKEHGSGDVTCRETEEA